MSYLEQLLQQQFTRRQVLIGSAIAGSTLISGSATSENSEERQEGLTPLFNTVNFDFFSSKNTQGIHYNYIDTLHSIQQLLGPEYAKPFWKLLLEFGPEAYTEQGFKNKVATRYPEYGLVAGAMIAFAPHGWSVWQCQNRFARQYGYDIIPDVHPIQSGLSIQNLHGKDELGNPSVLIHMSTDPIKKELHTLPNRKIVNISLQVGTLAVTHKRYKVKPYYVDNFNEIQRSLLTYYKRQNSSEYLFYDPAKYYIEEQAAEPELRSITTGENAALDGLDYNIVREDEFESFTSERKRTLLRQTYHLQHIDTSKSPYYEIQGAYTGRYGESNLNVLFELVNEFPDKLFFVAAGNYGDDIRPFREKYGENWPKNLVIAGHWDSAVQYPRMYNTYDVFGADIYVDGEQYGGEPGSSMATAVLSSAASILESRGCTMEEIIQKLYESCDDVEIETKPEIPVGSTNIEDYIEAEMNKKIELVKVFNPALFERILSEPVVLHGY